MALVVLLLAPSSCSTFGIGQTVLPPEVRIVDLEMLDSSVFEQRFRVTLRILNPNDFELPLDGLRFTLDLNEKPFARGYTAQGVDIPRLGDATLSVEASTSTFDVIRQVLGASERESLTYALDGTAYLGAYGRREVEFEQRGALELLPSDASHRFVPAQLGK